MKGSVAYAAKRHQAAASAVRRNTVGSHERRHCVLGVYYALHFVRYFAQSIRTLRGQVGDSFRLQSEALIYKCEAWESTASIWLGSPKPTTCMKSAIRTSSIDSAQARLPAGTKLTVVRIKHLNLYDHIDYYIYVSTGDGSAPVLVYDFEFNDLRGLSK